MEKAPILDKIVTFTERTDITKVLPCRSIGIVIGVDNGHFPAALLSTNQFLHLYCIDNFSDGREHDVKRYKAALQAIWPHKEKCTLIKMHFNDAIEFFADEYFDFIYFDGCTYVGHEAKRPLELWWKKLKKGGVFSGSAYDKMCPVVQKEVNEFVAQYKLNIAVLRPATQVDFWSKSPSWVALSPIAPNPDRTRELRAIATNAEAIKDWETAFASYDELFHTVGPSNLDIDTLSRRRRAGIKLSEKIRVSGDHFCAKTILKPIVSEMTEYCATKGIASTMSIPRIFSLFGAMMISHNVGADWLPRYPYNSDKISDFFQLLEVGDISMSPSDAAALTAACVPLLSKAQFGFWMLAHSLLFRSGMIEAAYIAKAEAAKCAVGTCTDPISVSAAKAFLTRTFVPSKSSNKSFANLIRGRSIALVGPAATDLSNGNEIDNFDLTIRTNPIAFDTLAEEQALVGSRTDVAYFNGIIMVNRREDAYNALRLAKNLKFACFREPIDSAGASSFLGPDKVRTYRLSPAIFMGRGYALRHYLSDLLQFEPKKIKVFNADFFLSQKTHYSGYQDAKLDLPHSYIVHDVFESWLYMKHLLKNGVLEADAVLLEILNLNEVDFYSRISSRLSSINSKELRHSK